MLVTNEQARRSWYLAAERGPNDRLTIVVLGTAERWATLMEPRLAQGESVAAIAKATLRAAVPADMGDKMVAALDPRTKWGVLVARYFRECWLYGDDYWRWYERRRRWPWLWQ